MTGIMIIGMNTEVEYQGKTYHVQTEDGGRQNPVITTQIFLKGAIILTQKTNYADIAKADYLEDIVRDLVVQQHTLKIKELRSGKVLEKKPVQTHIPADTTPTEDVTTAPADWDKSRKSLDDFILDYWVGEEGKNSS